MTLEEYWDEINRQFQSRANDGTEAWRYGQTAFNVLRANRPDLSEQIRSTRLDPFYRDAAEGVFWNQFTRWIIDNWES